MSNSASASATASAATADSAAVLTLSDALRSERLASFVLAAAKKRLEDLFDEFDSAGTSDPFRIGAGQQAIREAEEALQEAQKRVQQLEQQQAEDAK